MITIKNILVATDFSEVSDVALEYGRTLARTFGATLHVLHVTENVYARAFGAEAYVPMAPDLQAQVDQAARKQLDELTIDSDQSGPPTKKALLTSNSPALAIARYAKGEQINLIVIGTHGRGAVGHLFMGSVAERVVRTASCPVLTVHHPEREFVFPDTLVSVARA
jgi:nucleotide-binding universal stress UspA family protein